MPRLSHDKIKAPLSVPLMVATYLVDSLDEGFPDNTNVRVIWPRAYNNNMQWFLSVAGIAPNALGNPCLLYTSPSPRD